MIGEPYVVGLDPSLTGTGIATQDKSGQTSYREVGTKPTGRDLQSRYDRYLVGVSRIISSIVEQGGHLHPEMILIEGFAFAAKGNSLVSLAEYGALLRRALLDGWGRCTQIIEVTPGTVKIFACGKGNASKTQVATALAQRYNVCFNTDDAADAFALAKLAAMVVGFEEPATAFQRKAVETVKASIQKESPPCPPKKTKKNSASSCA